MTTFADYRDLRKPNTATVRLPADPSWPEQIADARADVAKAEKADRMSNDPSPSPATVEARERLAALQQAAVDNVLVFRFMELPRPEFEDLVAAHPPDEKDRGQLRWDNDTFLPALIAACCVEPDLTVEDAAEVWTEWGKWAADQLANAALDVNERASKVPTTPGG